MVNQLFTPSTASDARPTDALWSSLDAALAHLTAVLATTEAARTKSGIPTALAHNRQAVYEAMDVLGGWINGFLAARPSADQIEIAKARIVSPIRSWSRTGPFFDRSYGKLRGYPGDYEMLEIIYNCRPGGADLRARILDDYYLHTLVVRAIRHRLAYLVGQLGTEVQARAVQDCVPVRVLSMGCGPARELSLLADDPVFGEAAVITCLDPHAEALRYVRRRLNGRLNGSVSYLRVDPLRFARDPGRPSQQYHIIYTVGLFDYLGAEQATKLIEDCYGLLAPGGRLIACNLSIGLPVNERVLFEWLLELRPLYRGEEDYRRIFAGTSFGVDGLRFEYEPPAANLFVIAERTI